jgi:hypothetical protein
MKQADDLATATKWKVALTAANAPASSSRGISGLSSQFAEYMPFKLGHTRKISLSETPKSSLGDPYPEPLRSSRGQVEAVLACLFEDPLRASALVTLVCQQASVRILFTRRGHPPPLLGPTLVLSNP